MGDHTGVREHMWELVGNDFECLIGVLNLTTCFAIAYQANFRDGISC